MTYDIVYDCLSFRFEELNKNLSDEHIIKKMMHEHKSILGTLYQLVNLDNTNKPIDDVKEFEKNNVSNSLNEMYQLIKKLIQIDRIHHLKEDIIFQTLEEKGIFGMPYVMKLEHKEIHDYLEEVSTILTILKVNEKEFFSRKDRLSFLLKFLLIRFEDNIARENNNIYPLVNKFDEKVLSELEEKFKLIGYY